MCFRFFLLASLMCFTVSAAEVLPIHFEKSMNVDGFDLAYTCKGNNDPVTILEPPSGNASEEVFKNIFNELAKTNKTCAYARLGNGSDTRAEGLDLSGLDYVRQLEELIRIEADKKPVIIVGYSFGSFVARLYADKHPSQVKGLLLLDPPHHMWMQSLKNEMIDTDWEKMNGVLEWFKIKKGHNYWDTQFEVSEAELKPNLPVVIVSRGLDELKIKKAGLSEAGFRQFNDFHFKYLEEMKHLTTSTIIIQAPKSRHLILEYEPEIAVKGFNMLLKMIK